MQTTLYYKDGTSDKVYQVAVEPKGGSFVVNFAYGRRGGTLKPGTKTPSPVSEADAEVIYLSLVAEKTAKGYLPGEDGEAIVEAGGSTTSVTLDPVFIAPQLLNEISATEAAALLLDPAWMAEPKADGIRLTIHRSGINVCAFSRKGLKRTALPKPVMDAVLRRTGFDAFVIDGELVGDRFIAFEMLTYEFTDRSGRKVLKDARREGAAFRLGLLGSQEDWGKGVWITECATTEVAKIALLKRLKAEGAEGIVFKRIAAPHKSGRPNSGGDALKHKFFTAGSFIVTGNNPDGKRSVELQLFDGTRVGSCTIAPNASVPPAGAVIEVKYLYFVGSLVQASFIGLREDVDPEECTAAQLKNRQEVV